MSKAAAECNYSQSAVSQIISSLEKELQLTLLNRSQTGIWLTSDGKYMLPYIEALSNAEQNIYKQASKLKGYRVWSHSTWYIFECFMPYPHAYNQSF